MDPSEGTHSLEVSGEEDLSEGIDTFETPVKDDFHEKVQKNSLSVSGFSFGRAFECPNCGKTFAYKKRFISHMEFCAEKAEIEYTKYTSKSSNKPSNDSLKEKEDVSYDCTMCSQSFKRKTDLIAHKTSHSEDKPFECIECGRRFSKRVYLIKHIPTHGEEKVYTCHICGYQVARTDRYKLHMRLHGIENPFKCSLCGQAFPGLKLLNNHLNSHNSNALDPGANTSSYEGVGLCTFNCVDCKLTFDKADKYRQHMLKHGIRDPYECSFCGKSFSSKLQLNKHLNDHNMLQANTEASQSCVDNGEDEERKNYATHSGHKKGTSGKLKKYKVKADLHNDGFNSVKISNTRPESQDRVDGKSSLQNVNIDVNLNDSSSSVLEANSGELEAENSNLYSCKSCGLNFREKEDHLEHMKIRHNKLFACMKCGKSYTRKSNLKKHNCISRQSQGSYKCTTCEISFSCPRELDDHIMTHISGSMESDDDDGALDQVEGISGDGCLPSSSPEGLCFAAQEDAAVLPKKKKKKKVVQDRVSHHMFEMNDESLLMEDGMIGEERQQFSSHVVEMSDSDIDYAKKKKKLKHGGGMPSMLERSDYGSEFSKRKAKVKYKSAFEREHNNQGVRKKTKVKPKTPLQVLDMIEYELSKFESDLTIPTLNKREHEESELEYEKLVVYEFMNMNHVLPELDHSENDAAHDDVVKVNDQISLKFFS